MPDHNIVSFRINPEVLPRLAELEEHIRAVYHPMRPSLSQSDLVRCALGRGLMVLEAEARDLAGQEQD